MGMPLGIKYDYKELAENFSNRVVKSPLNSVQMHKKMKDANE